MNQIEYKLKFLLNSLTLKMIDIVDISEPNRISEFNSLSFDSKKIQSFCNSLSEITEFPMFGVPINLKEKIHKIYLCEVAVGESLVVGNDYARSLEIPSGFSSLIVEDTDSTGYLSEKNVDISKYRYVVKNKKFILPLYEVKFEYDDEFEKKSRNANICHKCKVGSSIVFCPAERANFCEKCDIQVHCDEFLKRHRRIYFSDVNQKKFICCNYHNTNVVEYFCEFCMEPICAECKITGRHSTKEFSEHKITTFLNACHALKLKIEESSEPIKKLEEICASEIERSKNKIVSFRNNMSLLREHVKNEFESIMMQLDKVENKQRQVLNAKFLERVQKWEYLNRIISYPKEVDPADLLTIYKNISEQRMAEEGTVFDKLEVQNVEIQGKITLKIPGQDEPRIPVSDTLEKSVKWRIESLHINKHPDIVK